MAMGKRRRHAKQASMWLAAEDLPRSAAHPFYTRLNQILDMRTQPPSTSVDGRTCNDRIAQSIDGNCAFDLRGPNR
jgi:hypothetical protein